MKARVFSPQGDASQVRQVHWPQYFVLSVSFIAKAGQRAGARDLGLEPGQEEPGSMSVESQAAPEPGPGPWHPCPLLDLE